MSRIWPDTLPGPSAPGYELSPAEQSVRTDMEVGAARVRRISRARRDIVSFNVRFTDVEMAAFRAWFSDDPWSLAGASDSLVGWNLDGTTRAALAVGPAGQPADRLVEDTSTGNHRAGRTIEGTVNGDAMIVSASLRAAGRINARLVLVDRSGVACLARVNLTTGAVESQSGLTSVSVTSRGGDWWRVRMEVPAGSGASSPVVRVVLLDDAGLGSYTGDGVSGVDVSEVMVRVKTGADLFVSTGADGRALGAAGGSAWVMIPLAFGGVGMTLAEGRFEGPFSANILPGVGFEVRLAVEVRNA